MHISLRLYKGVVHIPTSYFSGFFVTNTPLESVAVEQTQRLRQAILTAIGRGNPSISRDQARTLLHSKDDPLLKATGARSWHVLDRQTQGLWSIDESNGVYQIRVDEPMQPRGWHEDKTKRVEFPPGTPVEDVIDRLVAMIQGCARQIAGAAK
jgi:hypothetical protein